MYEFTLFELLISSILAFVFISMFKIQKKFTPDIYFSFSDIIYGLDFPPTRKSLVIRVIMIFILSLISMAILKEPKIVILGITLGSLLVVWPGFLDSNNIDSRVVHKKFLVYSLFFSFIAFTFFISRLATLSYNMIFNTMEIYISSFNSRERFITFFGDNIVNLVLGFIAGACYIKIQKKLNKEVSLRNKDYIFGEDGRGYIELEVENKEYEKDVL